MQNIIQPKLIIWQVSAADKIYVHPEGAVDFKGLYAQLMFMKGALDKLEIEPGNYQAWKI